MMRFVVFCHYPERVRTTEVIDFKSGAAYLPHAMSWGEYDFDEFPEGSWWEAGMFLFDTSEEAEGFAEFLITKCPACTVMVAEVTHAINAKVDVVKLLVNKDGVLPA